MRIYREYELTGGPKKVYKKRRLKKILIINDTRHKKIQIDKEWFREFCRELRIARISNHLTQRQLAKEIKSTQTWISELENGKLNPTLHSLISVTELLNLNLEITLRKRNTT